MICGKCSYETKDYFVLPTDCGVIRVCKNCYQNVAEYSGNKLSNINDLILQLIKTLDAMKEGLSGQLISLTDSPEIYRTQGRLQALGRIYDFVHDGLNAIGQK